MSKKFFESACAELESQGWVIFEYCPHEKYAVYTLNGIAKIIGRRKK